MPRKPRRTKKVRAEADRTEDGADYSRMTVALLACLVRRVEELCGPDSDHGRVRHLVDNDL